MDKFWLTFHRLPLLIVFGVTTIDQLTKFLVVKYIAYQKETIPIIPDFFDLVHITNKGAAWGIFNKYTWLLTIISFIAAIMMIIFFKKLHENKRIYAIATALIIGGTIGNFIDRLILSEVIDFLSFHWRDHYFPAFNIADSAICIGVFLYLVGSLFLKNKKNKGCVSQ